MTALIILFVVYVIASVWYIRRLHRCIGSHEQAWKQIHAMTDHNKTGDIVIHAQKMDR